jgi:AbrB family looped-hinge helix DNA binding protein
MKREITLSERGSLTIPAELRKAMGLKGNDRLIVETTDAGLLLRPAVLVPIEMYTDERIGEFKSDEAAIAETLPDLEAE